MQLGPIGQIALPVANTDRSEAFYEKTLGLRKLYRFGALAFFDCAGVRLMLSPTENNEAVRVSQSAIYFRVADIALAHAALTKTDATIVDKPHLIAPMPDHDLWMFFVKDPDGHLIGLMMEAPKGYTPKG